MLQLLQATKEVVVIAEKSRSEYFRKRRETLKQFTVTLKKEKVEALEYKLAEQNKNCMA